MNTAARISAMPMTGPDTSSIALQRRVPRAHPFFDVMLHRLDDDDRIVDDQADREHEAEERQRVDREAEQREDGERADQRHRHGEHRDQRRAPVLQEQEDDDDDEHHRFDERLQDLLDAFGDRQRRVERVGVVEIRREPAAAARSSALRTPSATASAFEPGAWKTATPTPGWPLTRPICW